MILWILTNIFSFSKYALSYNLKKAAYVVPAIDKDGFKKVLNITIEENESAKYWMTVLNDLKNREAQDILILCADGLTGLKDAYQQYILKQNIKDV